MECVKLQQYEQQVKRINRNCISNKQRPLRWMQIDEWNDCDYVSARSTESHQSIDGSSRRMDKCEIVRKIKFNQLSICYASIWFCWMDPKIIVTNGNGNDVFVWVWACVLITWKCDYCTFFISISACSSAAQKHKKPAIFFGHSSE